MSIEDKDSVDVTGVNESGIVELTISDYLKWDDERLYLLQEKINTYLVFMESVTGAVLVSLNPAQHYSHKGRCTSSCELQKHSAA